jgi:hypothetical protein
MRAVAVPGRWVWGLSGLITAAALAIPGARLIAQAGVPGYGPPPPDTMVRAFTVSQPVTSLDVQTQGTPVQVTAGPVRRVQVTETIEYDPKSGGAPAVMPSVSGGRLTLTDSVCNVRDCAVSFAVTVPPGVVVTAATEGGPIAVSGTAGAKLDSGSGPVNATRIDGPLTVTTEGGPLLVNGLTGPLSADTAGGPLLARNVAAATATVITGGGQAGIGFTAIPDTVVVSTDGGPATLAVPGGPYVLTVDSDGGPELVGIATDPAASRAITVTTSGGPLQIEPANRAQAKPNDLKPAPPNPPKLAPPNPAKPAPPNPPKPGLPNPKPNLRDLDIGRGLPDRR